MRVTYEGEYTREISFPLGGIGAGSIGLAGNGRLIDWEIFNRPNKGGTNGYSHIAVKAEKNGRLVDARVLMGDVYKNYAGELSQGFGSGLTNTTMAGFPHFETQSFKGEYPIATLDFESARFPGKPRLTAFSPFIPHNDRDSSIPGAFFDVSIKNDGSDELDYSVALTLRNPQGGSVNAYEVLADAYPAIVMRGTEAAPDAEGYGDMTIATDAQTGVSYQSYWFRGSWFDHLETFWRNFTEQSVLIDRKYETPGSGDTGTLCVRAHALPGETVSVRFVMTWNRPNNFTYWDPLTKKNENGEDVNVTFKNYYATLFEDSAASALYCIREYDRLFSQTKRWRDELFACTMPDETIEAIASTTSVLKTATCLRVENGDFWGWEGENEHWGSCHGTCTHVWNYAYAMPFLFPAIERNMRETDYKYNLHDSGMLSFRLNLPFGRGKWGGRACVDGQMGSIIKVCREWKLSGDLDWLRGMWPGVKKSMEYAWSEENHDMWDRNKDGVLEGRQHHTLDMEMFGPSSWLEGFYLAALEAAALMARAVGDDEAADEYESIFAKGKKWCDENLFNGEFYTQKLDLTDRDYLKPFGDADAVYWNSEAGQIKYQMGDGGCEIDQCLAQWHAAICGLGDIYDKAQLDTALRSIFRYNHMESVREHYNTFRIFAINDEAATIMCTYPDKSKTPAIPLPYAQESMHGFEYAFAGLLMSEGMISEGVKVVKAIRDRYNGKNRNPWNEIECGSNYARSMASFAMIPILSGFTFDMPKGEIGFDPKINKYGFRSVWFVADAWGNVTIDKEGAIVTVINGALKLKALSFPFAASVSSVEVDGKAVLYIFEGGMIKLDGEIKIAESIAVKF